MFRSIYLTGIVGWLGFSSAATAGPEWPEFGDAGALPGSAQTVVGVGTLKSIKGMLGGSPLTGPGDFQDMYLIQISDPLSFCAKTVAVGIDCCEGPFPITQPTNFNTQLWIFKADGTGILGNDDDAADAPRSRVGNAADDGSGAVIVTAGLYYVAISGGPNDDPLSAGGPIFNQLLPTEVSGPDGVGSAGAITGWTGGGRIGQYQILFCGASFVEAQSIPTTSEWGLIILTVAMAAGGVFLIRRMQSKPREA